MNISFMSGYDNLIKTPPTEIFSEQKVENNNLTKLQSKCLFLYNSGVTIAEDISKKAKCTDGGARKILRLLENKGLITYRRLTKEDKLALKEKNKSKCLQLIKKGVRTVDGLKDSMSLSKSAIYTYLHELSLSGEIEYIPGRSNVDAIIKYIERT